MAPVRSLSLTTDCIKPTTDIRVNSVYILVSCYLFVQRSPMVVILLDGELVELKTNRPVEIVSTCSLR